MFTARRICDLYYFFVFPFSLYIYIYIYIYSFFLCVFIIFSLFSFHYFIIFSLSFPSLVGRCPSSAGCGLPAQAGPTEKLKSF